MADNISRDNTYRNLPEDISPPKPDYFQDVFALVYSYIQLLKQVTDVTPGQGLIRLYGYRMGVLDGTTEMHLQQLYLDAYTQKPVSEQRTTLWEFAHGMVTYNLITLYQLVSNALTTDIVRGIGQEACLSSETIHALNHFAKFHAHLPQFHRQIYDSIDSVVETCRYNAIYPRGSVSSTETILRVLETLDQLAVSGGTGTPRQRRDFYMRILQIVFYIGCSYYGLNLLRFSDDILKRSYDRNLDITDLTLAAIPFDPTLIYSCADETSSISRWGIEYVQALEAVLLNLGGVRFAATLAVTANGNQGVNNV